MADGTRSVELPIVSVTVMEDRAHVVRRGRIELCAADERVRLERLAPVASDKTLSVTAAGDAGVRVVNARIERRAVVRLRDGEPTGRGAERDALEQARDDLRRRLDHARSDRDRASRQRAGLDELGRLSIADLAEDVSWGAGVADEWSARLDEIGQKEREVVVRFVELDQAAGELERELARLDRRIELMDGPSEEERASLDIDLHGPAGAGCEIRVDYIVPGACWRPWHTARLEAGTQAEVEIATDACVWQNTGEDWPDVELVFSTERASLGTEPPRLDSDVLRSTRRSEAVVVETREQEIETAGLGTGARVAAAELPGIDDAGEALTWRAASPAVVPSDGRPYRVRLGAFRSAAELELVGFPELAPAVITRSVQENRGGGPLLAGPVDLVRQSGLTGRTSVLYVAPGEKFELGWGPDPDLRIHREVEVLEEKSRMLSAWMTRRTKVRVRVSNLGDGERRVSITERIPVSEVEKVKIAIEPGDVTGKRRPDERGFVSWSVELPPYGHEELELAWELRRHEDVTGV